MQQSVSKSQFKAQVLQYLREVEKKKQPLVITHEGKPVVKVTPYTEDPQTLLKSLRGSITKYEDPTEPVGVEDWEALK
ncbi:MAG: type II toxin-antitoxin system prevent-host-death family antitoxin [Candidatus Curtissbacteria bacterium]|nr:type II toxin-antitoxin system prevent-host-death family antitoxin [Candidatus Curtissbacteria bacterium]